MAEPIPEQIAAAVATAIDTLASTSVLRSESSTYADQDPYTVGQVLLFEGDIDEDTEASGLGDGWNFAMIAEFYVKPVSGTATRTLIHSRAAAIIAGILDDTSLGGLSYNIQINKIAPFDLEGLSVGQIEFTVHFRTAYNDLMTGA